MEFCGQVHQNILYSERMERRRLEYHWVLKSGKVR